MIAFMYYVLIPILFPLKRERVGHYFKEKHYFIQMPSKVLES